MSKNPIQTSTFFNSEQTRSRSSPVPVPDIAEIGRGENLVHILHIQDLGLPKRCRLIKTKMCQVKDQRGLPNIQDLIKTSQFIYERIKEGKRKRHPNTEFQISYPLDKYQRCISVPEHVNLWDTKARKSTTITS